MFAKTIIDSDAFLDMSPGARLLYYDLAMRADDDGFINAPKKIMRIIGATQDELSELINSKFIIAFDSGVVVVKHWKINNYIRKDLYHETKYKEEKSSLQIDENGAYSQPRNETVTETLRSRDDIVSKPLTQVSIGKVSIDKVREKSIGENRKRFVPPTLDEVAAYCLERKNTVDPQRFVDYYTSNGWKVGKNTMKDWKAAVRTWENNGFKAQSKAAGELNEFYGMMQKWAESGE